MKYVEIKHTIAKAEREHGLYDVDPSTREILQAIAHANLSDTKIRVSDLQKQNGYGTLPTVLTRLQKLVEAGWIERKEDTEDGRVALLQITAKAKSIFRKISKLL